MNSDKNTWSPELARFEILEIRGCTNGGNAAGTGPHVVRDRQCNRTVLLNVFPANELERTFLHGVEWMPRLPRHPNIVELLDFGMSEHLRWYTTEYVDGCTLEKRLSTGRFASEQAAQLMETIARAIHFLHVHAYAHRFLTPAEILFTDDGNVKVTAFGQSPRDGGERGLALGYSAPEQATGEFHKVGPATDVYSLGAILYRALTGVRLFHAASRQEYLRVLTNQDPERVRRFVPEVPSDLESITMQCLRRIPSERYASAEAFADDLQRFFQGAPVHASPYGFPGLVQWVGRWFHS